MAHEVFISASSRDKPVADAACAALESAGIRCWIAPRDVSPGRNWGEAIIDAIRHSRVMVLVYSSHTNHSPHVIREVERAVNRSISVIPFRVENAPMTDALEYFISTPHWLDAFPAPAEEHFERLVRTVRGMLDAEIPPAPAPAAAKPGAAALPAPPTGVPATPPGTRSGAARLMLAAVFAAVVGAGAWAAYEYGRRAPGREEDRAVARRGPNEAAPDVAPGDAAATRGSAAPSVTSRPITPPTTAPPTIIGTPPPPVPDRQPRPGPATPAGSKTSPTTQSKSAAAATTKPRAPATGANAATRDGGGGGGTAPVPVVRLEDAAPARAKAQVLWERTRRIEAGDGFDAAIERADLAFREADAFFQGGAYGQARQRFEAAAEQMQALAALDVARKEAATLIATAARAAAAPALTAAARPLPGKKAAAVAEATGRLADARAAVGRRDFKAAAQLARTANDLFTESAAHADASAKLTAARTAYEAVAKEHNVEGLKGEPGEASAALKQALEQSAPFAAASEVALESATAAQLRSAADAFARAAELLPLAERAYAERLRGRRTAAAARAVTDARAALTGGPAAEGAAASAKALLDRALALDPDNAEAAEMLREIAPFLRELVNTIGMKLIRVDPCQFKMGSVRGSGDEWPHKVTLSKPFFLGAHEVTVAQFKAFVDETNYQTDRERRASVTWMFEFVRARPGKSWREPNVAQGDDHPVCMVSRADALAFCEWLSRKEGRTYRLPTEAEWECACRAGTTTEYCWGNGSAGAAECANLLDRGTVDSFDTYPGRDGFEFTAPAGRFKPNAWGFHDMHGNVWEWCADRHTAFDGKDAVDPTGPTDASLAPTFVVRGGSHASSPPFGRSADRSRAEARSADPSLGFRVAMDAPAAAAAAAPRR